MATRPSTEPRKLNEARFKNTRRKISRIKGNKPELCGRCGGELRRRHKSAKQFWRCPTCESNAHKGKRQARAGIFVPASKQQWERFRSKGMQNMQKRILQTAKNRSAARFKKERKRWAGIKQQRPERNAKYLAFARTVGCVVCAQSCINCDLGWPVGIAYHVASNGNRWACGQQTKSQACHMGPHGISQKASDYTAIPMCQAHHEKIGSSIKKLEAKEIHYKSLVAKLREAFEAQRK